VNLPGAVRSVFEHGSFCHVAAITPLGPHVTPMVFHVAGGRVWVTTSRRSVKARAWRSDPRTAGLVRSGEEAVAFTGIVSTHDVLDPSTWGRSLAAGPMLWAAATGFTRKNARFFAGYAVDAHAVPLAWTPPGRVFVEIRIDRVALVEPGRRLRSWGSWAEREGAVPSAERFRAARAGEPSLAGLPEGIRGALGDGGRAALALEGAEGPVVVPVTWAARGAGLYAIAAEEIFALAAVDRATARVALGIDHPSSWRARRMMGAMVRGTASIHVARRLTSGGRSARDVASSTGVWTEDPVVATIWPERHVWWRGWESGTVTA
jgi:nitroimidazol reductase NimA-like FMN-containing flavoprotein (pyridoxamine 5'-phosphate oxidase superfamily)